MAALYYNLTRTGDSIYLQSGISFDELGEELGYQLDWISKKRIVNDYIQMNISLPELPNVFFSSHYSHIQFNGVVSETFEDATEKFKALFLSPGETGLTTYSVYADNDAAIIGGLETGNLYINEDGNIKGVIPGALTIEYTGDAPWNLIVGDTELDKINLFFQVADYATSPFTSLISDTGIAILKGATNLSLAAELFSAMAITKFIDTAGIVVSGGDGSNIFFGSSLVELYLKECTNFAGGKNCSECPDLVTVNLPKVTIVSNGNNQGCFKSSPNLINVNMPKLLSVGKETFYGIGAAELILQSATETLGNAFRNSSIISLSLPKATRVTSGACQDCADLVSVNLPLCEELGTSAFAGSGIRILSLPKVTQLTGGGHFEACSLQSLSMPVLEELGDTTGSDDVFLDVDGNTIELTIPEALMTAMTAFEPFTPDGDIVALQDHNTVTITTV